MRRGTGLGNRFRTAFASHFGICEHFGAWAPGSGTIGDPTYDEGIVYTVGGGTFAGDVILCESTSLTCNASTPTSEWSDVLVFFNSVKGPYLPEAPETPTARTCSPTTTAAAHSAA